MVDVERRAVEAELPSVIERLRGCASRGGQISRKAFADEADRLGLTSDEQRRRLRDGLAALGMQVKPARRAPTSPVEPYPAPPAVPSAAATRLAQARRMLARYADADGTVSRLAHDGVVRLHGLGAAEVRELTADFPITRPGLPVPVAKAVVSKPSTDKKRPMDAAVTTDDRLSDAVRAARAVLESDLWRRDVGKVVLKADEEVGLAVLLRVGTDRLGRDVPAEEVKALPRDGERWRAYQCLVLHNRRLVWKIAQGYQGRGLDIEDLVQHGSLGLMRAARKFDATKGYKFSTYATWWIRQAITRAIADEGTLIRLPVHVHEKVSKVAVAERKLLNEGRPRTVDNVAYVSGLTFAEVEKVRKISRPTDSLDRIIGDDTALGDLVMGPSRLPGPADVLIRKELMAQLRLVLEHLDERERYVLVRRTGLDGDEPDTLEDIGVVYGVTRERIRQIESKTRAKFYGHAARHALVPPPR
ncbi:sigma-70 family RNA polymerase sigma factor [Streptomyces pseudovenezuelae]|uniref:sigma-70 family RNA polymerase sigma factor n=1 Tax=Streptomyces pseudovenezuelae TaxID=67350 RepID=UPI002E81E8EB|nr:sigma-70 family RNA polymerase sigma factor [Streptomyces pseudovenezuelae]WUA87917.1 sigma-70 family RNA polymerase sigma factor [Streptomyces pseudovenezuelae]